MKHLLKIIFLLMIFFLTILLIVKFSDVLPLALIKNWLVAAQELSPLYVGALVILLLFVDLFLAMPTLTITILAGFFLGHIAGAMTALVGLSGAGCFGYALGYCYGDRALRLVLRDEQQRHEAVSSFKHNARVMIILSRAMPMLPEISACLAGATRMPFVRFYACWLLSTIPYVLVAAWAGSISSIDNPKPALYVAMGMAITLWGAWIIYIKKRPKEVEPKPHW